MVKLGQIHVSTDERVHVECLVAMLHVQYSKLTDAGRKVFVVEMGRLMGEELEKQKAELRKMLK